MGEAQDLKPVLAPVFVQPLRSRAKRRRRSGGLLLAAVLAVVVTASKLAQQHPHAALERVAKAVAPANEARASNRGRSPVRPDAAEDPAPVSAARAPRTRASRGHRGAGAAARSCGGRPRAPQPADFSQWRGMGGAKTQKRRRRAAP